MFDLFKPLIYYFRLLTLNYLPKFEVLHFNKIVSHLINVCKYSKTKALYELKMFKMMVNNLWWGK